MSQSSIAEKGGETAQKGSTGSGGGAVGRQLKRLGRLLRVSRTDCERSPGRLDTDNARLVRVATGLVATAC